ncbi:TldD/PmbA family protein [Candidatus Magnetobacterium bavaricum]|uniref:TldD/PmbA family protein n=1 Tax=Candidatus Magnetobacterium bavaricum TaxID=29290 RepID=A0A0F3GIC1_9BACT|nr:TldD/PmbA family protein [Candidatus Magnetobacterium bavaricum]
MDLLNEGICSELITTALSCGGEYADVYFEDKTPLSITMEDQRIEKVSTGRECGVGIRVIFGHRTAYAYTNDISRESLHECALTVSRAVRQKTAGMVADLRRLRPTVNHVVLHRPETVPMEKKIALIHRANSAVRKVSDKIVQVSVSYMDSVRNVLIANSIGNLCEDKKVQTLFVINVIVKEDSVIQTGYETIGGSVGFELFDDINVESVALKAALRALGMLRARRVSGGRMPVVISSEAGGTMIHEAIGHGLEADLAQQGLSVYSDKKGQLVASPLVTVIDDATIAGKRGSCTFDDEATACQRNVLVQNGVITQYMYDRLTAMRDGVHSTGNGRRQSYQSRPIPRMTNTYLAPGSSPVDDIIKDTPTGLFVKKMGGGQVNTVTGDFVFDVQEGFLIKDGMIDEPVRGATLCGNGPAVLNCIDMIGSDLGFAIGTCGKDGQGVPVSGAMPTVRIPDIVVGGEV